MPDAAPAAAESQSVQQLMPLVMKHSQLPLRLLRAAERAAAVQAVRAAVLEAVEDVDAALMPVLQHAVQTCVLRC